MTWSATVTTGEPGAPGSAQARGMAGMVEIIIPDLPTAPGDGAALRPRSTPVMERYILYGLSAVGKGIRIHVRMSATTSPHSR